MRSKSPRAICLSLTLLAAFVASCATNFLEPQAPSSPVEEAQLLLVQEKFADARALLEAFLSQNPNDAKAGALFATTFAGEAGVSIIVLTERTLNSGGGAGEDEILQSILPDATDANIALIRRAKEEIESIPEAARNSDITFEATIYSTAFLFLSLENLVNSAAPPTPEQAREIIKSVAQASELAEQSGVPAEQIEKAQAEIANAPGDTDEEKLDNYLDKLREENGGVLPEVPADAQ